MLIMIISMLTMLIIMLSVLIIMLTMLTSKLIIKVLRTSRRAFGSSLLWFLVFGFSSSLGCTS